MVGKNINKNIGVGLTVIICTLVSLLISLTTFAANSEKVKIGFVFGITGPYATYGVPMRDAMNWALKEINSKGGFEVKGENYLLDVIYYDHASKPELEGPTLIKKALYSDRVPLLLLGGSPVTRVALPWLEREKTPTVVILAGMIGVAERSPFLFRIRPDATQCAPPLATYFVKELGAKRIALIGADTDFGRDSGRMWKETTERLGGEIISEEWYVPGKVEDFYPILSKVKALNPDAVYIAGTTQQNALVYKHAYEVGLDVLKGGYTGMTPEQARDLIGTNYDEVMETVYESRGVDPGVHPDKKVREWYQEFKRKFGYYPADLTMWAWDAPFLAIQAFKRAGSVTDKEKIREALAELTIPSEAITPYRDMGDNKLFDENGQAYSLAVVLKWKDKEWLPLKYYSVVKGEIEEAKVS